MKQIDALLAAGATRVQIERALGLAEGSLADGDLVTIQLADALDRALRLPSPVTGNQFHMPGSGLTIGGLNEAVIDAVSKGDPGVIVTILEGIS